MESWKGFELKVAHVKVLDQPQTMHNKTLPSYHAAILDDLELKVGHTKMLDYPWTLHIRKYFKPPCDKVEEFSAKTNLH